MENRVKVLLTNQHSPYAAMTGYVELKDWMTTDFWIPVKFKDFEMLICGMYLKEIG